MNQIHSTLYTLKSLSSLMRISQFEKSIGTPEDIIDNTLKRLSTLCRTEGLLLSQTLDFGSHDQEWSQSLFAQYICDAIADRWPKDREQVFEVEWHSELASIANPEMYRPLPSSWNNSSPEISYIATAIGAINRVMIEYQKFNLFMFDQAATLATISDRILSKSKECAEKMASYIGDLNDDEMSSLVQGFIKQSGFLLSAIWSAESHKFLAEFESADANKRQLMRTEYDLSRLLNAFDESMDSLNAHAISAHHQKPTKLMSAGLQP